MKAWNRKQRARFLLFGLVILAVSLALGYLQALHSGMDRSDETSLARGQQIYISHCAACHGHDLKGQPNWRDRNARGRLPAPPHDITGHTWHHSDATLFGIVKHGLLAGRNAPAGYQSDMPAFGDMLADADIRAVLAFIKSTWPAHIRAKQAQIDRLHQGE